MLQERKMLSLTEQMKARPKRRQSGLKFGGRGSGSKKLKISLFSGNFTNFDFLGKNWPFTATSGQIILFFFKSHHFRTYFLYMIRYNNISRPAHDPPIGNIHNFM